MHNIQRCHKFEHLPLQQVKNLLPVISSFYKLVFSHWVYCVHIVFNLYILSRLYVRVLQMHFSEWGVWVLKRLVVLPIQLILLTILFSSNCENQRLFLCFSMPIPYTHVIKLLFTYVACVRPYIFSTSLCTIPNCPRNPMMDAQNFHDYFILNFAAYLPRY